mgnify:CR=1 FL=1
MEKGKREQKDKAKIIAVSSVMSIIGSGAILLAAQFFSSWELRGIHSPFMKQNLNSRF